MNSKRILSPVEILLKGRSGGGGGGGGGSVAYAAIGSVLYHAGTTPPAGYLVCDGTVYNIVDYPDLAQFFADNYGSANYWGGDGTTTFAVPDWRGEFFRASGTNSHVNAATGVLEGSGETPGGHQDASVMPDHGGNYGDSGVYQIYTFTDTANVGFGVSNPDSNTKSASDKTGYVLVASTSYHGGGEASGKITVRPTNTSLLVCIKAKMVDNMAELVAAVVQQMRSQLDPVGKIIYYAGLTAPANYLACDGTVYNIVDYPELAQFFAANYGSANHWGGDGTTTFAVPDWRGEFFRASGQNSHAQQGSGAAVGVHQDATQIPKFFASSSDSSDAGAAGFNVNPAFNAWMSVNAPDSVVFTRTGRIDINGAYHAIKDVDTAAYTSRPTNTSLLVCIKAT